MRKWMWIAPALVLAACSKPTTPTTAQTPAPSSTAPSAAANTGQLVPVPVAPPEVAAPVSGNEPPQQAGAAPAPQAIEIPRGARLRVRLDRTIDTRRNRPGDAFTATLSAPLYVNGDTLLPAGTHFRGHVTESAASGRMEGRAQLGVTLDAFHAEGREHPIRTSTVERIGAAHKKRNAVLIGGGAGLGAAIGAIAGGGKGAAIGALAGGGAGTAGAAATGKEELTMPAETSLVFIVRR